MIVPSIRLVWVAAVAATPALTAAGFGYLLPAVAVIAVLGAVAAADARMGLRRAGTLGVDAPGRIRATQNKPAKLAVTVRNAGGATLALRLGLVLPDGLESEAEVLRCAVPGSSQHAVEWEFLPARRGAHRLDTVHVESSSPLGLWEIRKAREIGTTVAVYPGLDDPATRQLLRRGDTGLRTYRQVGKGREFEKLREYLPGDPYDDIHWKATARRGAPVVKQYQVEHSQEVYVALDHSRLTGREEMLEYSVRAALHLAIAAQQNGDRFGLTTFSDRVQRFARAGAGPAHFRTCREAIYHLQPHPVNPDFREIFAAIGANLRRRSLLLFFTALDDPLLGEEFEAHIGLLARRHLVVVHTLQARSVRPVFASAPPDTLDEAYGALGGQMLWNRLQTLRASLRNSGVWLDVAPPAELRDRATARYLDVKRRQVL